MEIQRSRSGAEIIESTVHTVREVSKKQGFRRMRYGKKVHSDGSHESEEICQSQRREEVSSDRSVMFKAQIPRKEALI